MNGEPEIEIVDEMNKTCVGLGLKIEDGPIEEDEFPDVSVDMGGFWDFASEEISEN